MKIIIAIKGVPDFTVPVRVKPDGSGTDMGAVRRVINPFDEIAVEEAVRLKEKGTVTELIAVTMGLPAANEVLRHALAMGADRGILVEAAEDLQPLATAKILAHLVREAGAEICLLGKQAVDTDNNQTGQMLAGILGWSQGTFASKVTLNTEGVEIVREVDGGLETVQLKLPAVITTDLRLNLPRYLSLPNIVKAKQKPIKIIAASSLGPDLQSRQQVIRVSIPKRERAGERVSTPAALLEKLRAAGVVR